MNDRVTENFHSMVIEKAAAAVHQAYLDTCDSLGWPVKPENRVDYAALSEESKDLDRATAQAAIYIAEANGLVVGRDMYDDVLARRDWAEGRLRELVEAASEAEDAE